MTWAHGTTRKSTTKKTTKHAWRGKPRRYLSHIAPQAKKDPWQHKAQGK